MSIFATEPTSPHVRSNVKARVKMVAVALGLIALSTSVRASLLTNESFESPVLVPGSDFLIVPVGGGAIPGWTVVGPAGKNVAIIEALYNLPDSAGINFAASNGVQWIDLTGGGANAYEGLAQTVATTPGSYNLEFDIGNVVAPAANLGTQSTIDLWLNGVLVQSFTNSSAGGGAINWETFKYSFAATGATKVEFRNADASGDNFNGLDNVVLAAVPEPASWLLSLVGATALGLLARRRGIDLVGQTMRQSNWRATDV